MTTHQARNRAVPDRGFTLIEVIVTTVMIALVAGVLAAAITVIFRSEGSAIRVAAESHDTQQGVNYFPLDIQAGPTSLVAYDTSSLAGGCAAPVGTTNVLDFTKGLRRVSYRLQVVGTTGRLDRYTCSSTGTDIERVNIADTLDATSGSVAEVALQGASDGTLQTAVLSLAQDGATVELVGSPRADRLNAAGDCQTDNPIEQARGYGVFTETEVLLKGGDVTGWLAVGGELAWDVAGVEIATNNMGAVDPPFPLYANSIAWGNAVPGFELIVGRQQGVALGNGFTQSGDLVYDSVVGAGNFLNLIGASNPTAVAISSLPAADQIDFTFSFGELRNCSAQLARAIDLCAATDCVNEVDVTVTGNVVNVCSQNPVAQVLNVPEQFLNGTYSFTTSGSGCQGFSQVRPLIVNVIEDPFDAEDPLDPDDVGLITIDTNAVDWTALGDRKNILFNFSNSFNIVINGTFWGEILAPFAHVQTYNDLQGGVVARQWTHHLGTITADDDIFNGTIDWPS